MSGKDFQENLSQIACPLISSPHFPFPHFINWGLVSGKTQTIYPWDWSEDKGAPSLCHHDIFNTDGTLLHPVALNGDGQYERYVCGVKIENLTLCVGNIGDNGLVLAQQFVNVLKGHR